MSLSRRQCYIAAMTALPKDRMTVDEYLAWAESQPGRFELYAGTVYAMTPERAVHAKVKFAVQTALAAGVRRARLPCHMLPDGMTVRIDRDTAHEPDALVYCGEEVGDDAVEVPNPIIVVEVLSPSTRNLDASLKLASYFRLPSVQHYLLVNPDRPLVIHHARGQGDTIATRIVTAGALRLEPPGIDLTVEALYQV
jgi:Uma2 family endonuclease